MSHIEFKIFGQLYNKKVKMKNSYKSFILILLSPELKYEIIVSKLIFLWAINNNIQFFNSRF